MTNWYMCVIKHYNSTEVIIILLYSFSLFVLSEKKYHFKNWRSNKMEDIFKCLSYFLQEQFCTLVQISSNLV